MKSKQQPGKDEVSEVLKVTKELEMNVKSALNKKKEEVNILKKYHALEKKVSRLEKAKQGTLKKLEEARIQAQKMKPYRTYYYREQKKNTKLENRVNELEKEVAQLRMKYDASSTTTTANINTTTTPNTPKKKRTTTNFDSPYNILNEKTPGSAQKKEPLSKKALHDLVEKHRTLPTTMPSQDVLLNEFSDFNNALMEMLDGMNENNLLHACQKVLTLILTTQNVLQTSVQDTNHCIAEQLWHAHYLVACQYEKKLEPPQPVDEQHVAPLLEWPLMQRVMLEFRQREFLNIFHRKPLVKQIVSQMVQLYGKDHERIYSATAKKIIFLMFGLSLHGLAFQEQGDQHLVHTKWTISKADMLDSERDKRTNIITGIVRPSLLNASGSIVRKPLVVCCSPNT